MKLKIVIDCGIADTKVFTDDGHDISGAFDEVTVTHKVGYLPQLTLHSPYVSCHSDVMEVDSDGIVFGDPHKDVERKNPLKAVLEDDK
jgi:hypothetical protein